MVPWFNPKHYIAIGFFEAALASAASPLTERVMHESIRVACFVLASGLAAVMKLVTILSKGEIPNEAIPEEVKA